ncbi:Yae1p [Kluyveromyces lactis]|uniref:Protein YAE1 n=1 Tax=Kluyveromyces lactis (strain ATCC 8585 / CBS 2359 / DSM 70799 / NBRC 1267 / NRRL Y-1140 / WM37) TaxID=284590 RepID=YAE1_KLULA|nr:uncharacterized protein KLLA0_B13970g [Kluyveromyces lactis]Q6CV86.1 RecName: Full=Protein YAE1 [Kluyveromyces lactis NRRL Y-1140]CAH02546.1 KLLA0B13970p [Kluyveromyces lactis]|eukprot:XP_452153.1 uncharacterized protein KLLA0_B13970g [Kluyveromyces lactis]
MTVEMTDEENIWGSDNEASTGPQESLEVKKLQQIHSKRGYLDGISSAKEENLQAGFDDTFPLGAKYGFQIGEIVGKLRLFTTLYGNADPQVAADLKQAQDELRINRVLSARHFDEELQPLDSLKVLLSKWQARVLDYEGKYS